MICGPHGSRNSAVTAVVVKSHKPPGKKAGVAKTPGHPYEYEYGRIQITVPKEFIGLKANIRIEFPNLLQK